MVRRSLVVVAVCGLSGGCLEDYKLPYNTGSLGGRVVISSGVRGARISVDQLNAHTGKVYQHVGDAISTEDGWFQIEETREANGLFLLAARGGVFEDLASGATIQLDDDDELRSLLWFPIVDQRDDALISPVGHLIEARAWSRFEVLGDMTAAVEEASRSLHKHFGNAEWGLLKLHDLGKPATSPTAPVRAAFVHAALSYLSKDIAAAAGASPQQVNVYTLLQRWTADLTRGNDADPAVFDGNDGNDPAFASGLQLGLCEPIEPGCVAPPAGCTIGHCRTSCDLYVGTARSMLAGAMTKVIRDTGEGGVNRTGLRIEDMLAVARAVSDNVDPTLFGAACVETLDRTRPEVRWDEAATPAADAVVRGVVSLKAIGLDDVDLQPRTEIVGYADQDGDPSNNVAIALIDAAGVGDGGLTVTARVTDLAGNSSTIERRLIVDNTAPQIELAPAGFFIDSDNATWWTTTSGPTLTGTVVDAHPASVQATIGAMQVPGTLSDGSWSVALPANAIDLAGANVTIRVTDRAGNHAELTQRIRRDSDAPVLDFQTSTVNNEAAEIPTFTSGNILQSLNHIPVHMHGGPTVNLDVAGACPSVTKYSYLLGESAPPYGYEVDSQGNARRNPIRYQLVAADDGVGIAPGSTQYRVGRRTGATTTWILDWTSTGTGTPTTPGATQYGVGIFSNLIAGLATTEGIYDVEFRATDRLARTTTAARCFDLELKAPPLEFVPLPANPQPPVFGHHTFSIDSLSLAPGAPHDLVAQRLLNDNATGASLIDQPFYNGTASTVYLTVTVTKPAINAARKFRIDHARRAAQIVWIPCATASDCPLPGPGTEKGTTTLTAAAADFPVRVYELDANGAPTTEIPCIGPCAPSGTSFKFAIPPRPTPISGAEAKKYMAMTMIGQVRALWPKDLSDPNDQGITPPFVDAPISAGMPRISGLIKPPIVMCTRRTFNPVGGGYLCEEQSQLVPYRALTSVTLQTAGETKSNYATAAAESIPPAPVTERKRFDDIWTMNEGALP